MPKFETVLRPRVVEEEEPSMAQKWAKASKRWAKESSLAYLSNPAARRDFKVQFRGGKSGWLIATYLVLLSAITMFEYAKASDPNLALDQVQMILQDLYRTIMTALGIAVALVAPALSATAIVAERQRRSLDLVFCAPVRPRTYLIGKLLASLRFIGILLALSLPFTGICIMMGGATWFEVIGAFSMMSMLALIYTSIGLVFSSRSEKPIPAVFYTYLTVFGSIIGSIAIGQATSKFDQFGSYLQNALAFLFNPITLVQSVTGFTPILGVPVPNLLAAALISFGVVRLCLAAAGSVLVPQSTTERGNLRVSAAGAMALVGGLTAHAIFPNAALNPGIVLNWVLLPLAIFVPFLSCYGYDAEQKSLPNGLFKIGEIFKGTPAGGLPQILLTVGATIAGVGTGSILAGAPVGPVFLPYVLYAAGLWTFGWACGRVASSFLGGVRASQMLQLIVFGGVMAVPASIAGYLSNGRLDSIWTLLNPISAFANWGHPLAAGVWGIILLLLSVLGAGWSESNRKKRLLRRSRRSAPADAVGA